MPQAVLGLGSNIAPAKEHLDKAVEALSNLGTVKEVSPYILSKPEGFANQPD
jgi:7,8-dihydro-6-hydroxymethylpterin-pyrophosphokinase